jgi:hypothetical protein
MYDSEEFMAARQQDQTMGTLEVDDRPKPLRTRTIETKKVRKNGFQCCWHPIQIITVADQVLSIVLAGILMTQIPQYESAVACYIIFVVVVLTLVIQWIAITWSDPKADV